MLYDSNGKPVYIIRISTGSHFTTEIYDEYFTSDKPISQEEIKQFEDTLSLKLERVYTHLIVSHFNLKELDCDISTDGEF